MNSEWVMEQTAPLGKRLAMEPGDDAARIAETWWRVLSGPPTDGETARAAVFVASRRVTPAETASPRSLRRLGRPRAIAADDRGVRLCGMTPFARALTPNRRPIRFSAMKAFTAVIERCPHTGLYIGYVPGFSGTHSQGKSLDELQRNLREVIEIRNP